MKLADRFEALGRTRTPDLWPVIERRETRPVSEPPHRHRILAATVALAVAAAGMGLLVYAFGRDEQPRPAASVQNGKIAFLKAVQSDDYINGEQTDIYVMNPDGSGVTPLIQDPTYDTNPAWSPDGTRIVFSRGGLLIANADGTSVKTILEDGTGATDPSWSPAGTRIVFESGLGEESTGSGDRDLFVINADGSGLTRLTADPAREGFPAWSPDGTKIAFVRYLAPSDPEIFLMNADGAGVAQLTTDGDTGLRPAWSPDGTQLAFERHGDINVVGADGSGLRNLTNDPASDGDPAWSPDGTKIAFASDRDGDFDIYVMNTDGTTLTKLTDEPLNETSPTWQPVPTDKTLLPTETPKPSPSSIVARVTHTIDVAPFPNVVSVGEGGVWVSAPKDDGSGAGDIVCIDPVTGRIVTRIPVESLPSWEVGGGGMAVGLGSLWVMGNEGVGRDCCNAVIQQIDPTANQVVDVIHLGDGFDADVWVDETGIWGLKFGPDHTSLEVVRVDPATHEVVARGSIPALWSQTIFRAGEWIWVVATEPHAEGSVNPNTLFRIDPDTAVVVESIPLSEGAWIPAVAPDGIWVRMRAGILRIDLESGQPSGAPIPPPPGCCTRPFVGDGMGGVWVANERRIWHMNSEGVIDASGEIPGDEEAEAWNGVAYGFDPETQTIWVVHYRDSVSRIQVSVT